MSTVTAIRVPPPIVRQEKPDDEQAQARAAQAAHAAAAQAEAKTAKVAEAPTLVDVTV